MGAKLKIDAWYSVMLVLSAFILLLSLTMNLKVSDQAIVQLASLGGVFIGLGEIINHPMQQAILSRNIITGPLKVSGKPWKPTVLGIIFDFIGLAFVIAALVRAV